MGLATTTAVMVATDLAAKRGALFRQAVSLEQAFRIEAIMFDNTGTLTQGKAERGRRCRRGGYPVHDRTSEVTPARRALLNRIQALPTRTRLSGASPYSRKWRVPLGLRTRRTSRFARPTKEARSKHIDSLFSDTIDWELIETHWQDLLQMVLSIKPGTVSSVPLFNPQKKGELAHCDTPKSGPPTVALPRT